MAEEANAFSVGNNRACSDKGGRKNECNGSKGANARVRTEYGGSSQMGLFVRCGSHWGGSLQNGLGDEQTCGTTLASAYVLHRLSAAWSQLQMKERESEWE